MKHAATTARRMPRKTLIASVTVAALLATAGVAYALYLITAKVTGNVSTSTLTYAWVTNPTAPFPTSAGTATCTVGTISTSDTSVLPSVNVAGYPGDDCTITASMRSIGTETARVTGTALVGLPTGWTAEVLPSSCGLEVAQAAAGTPVSFKITVGPSGTGAITGGLKLSPKSQTGGATSNVVCSVQTAP